MTIDRGEHTIVVHHVEVRAAVPAADVHRKLIALVPRLDSRLARILRAGDREAVERERREGPPLWLFEVREMGSLLAVEGRSAVVYQYEIGNPVTAESMVRYAAGAGLYAPLRLLLYEEDGGSVLVYDAPSDLFGQFGDERVAKVGGDLQEELEAVLRQVLSEPDRPS